MLQLPSVDDARRLYAFFVANGYSRPGFVETLGSLDPPLPQTRNMPRFLDQTREPTPFNLLARWFFMGLKVAADTAREQLPDWFLDSCLTIGLLRQDGDDLASTTLLVPYEKLLVASDLYQKIASADAFDHVLTINPAAHYLLNFTRRQPVRTTLDLGAGCAIQALAAAAHSDHVVATDLNPRATMFAEFNARLNGFDNIECLTGDTFAPVAGRTFDLIVCNPPFVLAPAKRFIYRDSGMALDQFCRRLVKEAPRYLNEGGYFQMICEWVQIRGQPWQERIGEWFEGAGCDVWVQVNFTQKPAAYAQTRLREMIPTSAEADAGTYTEWMDFYREQGVESIQGGLIAMRRRAGPTWFRLEEQPKNLQEPFGDSIAQGFAARDFLETHGDDETLAATRPRLSPTTLLEQEYQCAEGHWRTQIIRLKLTQGLPYQVNLDGDVAQFLARFDGQRSVAELIQELITATGADPARVRSECLQVVRLMLERGFLLP